MSTFLRARSAASYYGAFLTLALSFFLFDCLRLDVVNDMFIEGSAVEWASAITFGIAAALWFVLPPAGVRKAHWHLPVIIFLMCLRELDADKAFTSKGIIGLKLYTGAWPVQEKIFGLVAMAGIFWLAFRLIRMNLSPWLRGLTRRDPVALLVLLGGVILVVAKSLDGIARKLAPWGYEVSARAGSVSMRIEELLELFTGIALAMAIVVFSKNRP